MIKAATSLLKTSRKIISIPTLKNAKIGLYQI
mgnify:CR=1 FL=1